MLALGGSLAEALIAVHSAGLVHRDLKPSNVLLSAEGPRVIDFGIVRATDGYELTLSGVLLGSPRYMCPEHATGDPMGPEGDVFCLGSVLAFAATGKAPFDGASAATLLYQVVHGTPDLTGVPDPLDTIIELCLDKSPTARPSPDRVSAACAPVAPTRLTGAAGCRIPWPPPSGGRPPPSWTWTSGSARSRRSSSGNLPARPPPASPPAAAFAPTRAWPSAARHGSPEPHRLVFPEKPTPGPAREKPPAPFTHRAERPTRPRL